MPLYFNQLNVIDLPFLLGGVMLDDEDIVYYDCDVFDAFKDDIASMEHPIYSLSKLAEHRVLNYERNGCKIEITSGVNGLPTILDKDIMVFLTSSLMASRNKGDKSSQYIRFSARDYLLATKKGVGGSQYNQLAEGMDRLVYTKIKTNIKTNGIEITEVFGLIDSISIRKTDKTRNDDRVIEYQVRLSDWCYNSIIGSEVLTIDPDYFNLRTPTDKRIYEIARKHCGNKASWKIGLEVLKEKLGTTSPIRTLRFNIRKIIEKNNIPEYGISMESDMITFTRKYPPREVKSFSELSPEQKKVSIEREARPGESRVQVTSRLTKLKEALK